MSVAALISEYEQRARTDLDPETFNYFASGTGTEVTLGEANSAWSRYRLRPHVLRDVTNIDVRTEVLGTALGSPVGVAPFAYQRLLHDGAEVACASGSGPHLFVLSARSTRPIEEVGAAASAWWFQVYVTRDTSLSVELAMRARDAGASALVLTGDTPYVATRARASQLRELTADDRLVNFGRHLPPDVDAAAAGTAILQSPGVTMAAIGRLHEATGLPVLVKGVLRADDARRCLAAGAAGLIVSTHGGRQLDRAVPSAAALPDVVAAAGPAPVLVDGGIRSGLDVLTALALGARAVLLGRPVAWALHAGGAHAVTRLLAGFDGELEEALALAGVTCCADASPDLIATG